MNPNIKIIFKLQSSNSINGIIGSNYKHRKKCKQTLPLFSSYRNLHVFLFTSSYFLPPQLEQYSEIVLPKGGYFHAREWGQLGVYKFIF